MKTRKQFFFVVTLIGLSIFQGLSQTFEETVPRERKEVTPTLKPEAPNQITGRRGTYKGVFVQMVKSRAPWQLINPFAPSSYGEGNHNYTTDPSTEKPDGLKLFSIEF